MKVLETDRLVVRWLTIEDAGFILGLVNEPSWIRYIGDRGVHTIEDATNYILKGPADSYARLGFGLYLVELKGTQVPIGICGLLKRDVLPDIDLGFAFVPTYWGQGYARESALAVLAHAKKTMGLRRVLAITSPDNERSIGLLEKIGFTFDGMVTLSDDHPASKLFSLSLGEE
ncbi:MAG TPA: GNAT family N-acetyltransferase [Vicinamibacterales bacterium]